MISGMQPDAATLLTLKPWARAAAAVVRAVAARPMLVSASDEDIASAAGTNVGLAAKAVEFIRVHHLAEADADRSEVSARLQRLSWRLEGVADVHESESRDSATEIVLTIPSEQADLVRRLPDNLDAIQTRDGFQHVAAQAISNLTFLVPFIDESGARALVDSLTKSPALHRIVVVRPDSRGRRWYADHVRAIAMANARIVEYWSPAREGGWNETFHAKIAIADTTVAYIGSANWMDASLERSLECGVLLRGKPLRPLRSVVDAVVEAGTIIHEPINQPDQL
jgi:phosphatidylserine/phosphatidylglycerophosphate/cardiolipin synthase-like enzyme